MVVLTIQLVVSGSGRYRWFDFGYDSRRRLSRRFRTRICFHYHERCEPLPFDQNLNVNIFEATFPCSKVRWA